MEREITRFAEMLERTRYKSMLHDGTIWMNDRKVIRPFGPACLAYSVNDEEAEMILRKLEGIVMRWTDGFGENKCPEWYAVICDRFISLEESRAKVRWEIKKSLNGCQVRRVDAPYIAREGPSVFTHLPRKFGNIRFSEAEIRDHYERTMIHGEYEDLMHYWGVFAGGKLVGYAVNVVFGRQEVAYSAIRLHRDYLPLYPGYALVYTMNEYYLRDHSIGYVNDGFRSILHQTAIQRFLIDKFSFKKAHTNLNVAYAPLVRRLLKSTYPFRRILGPVSPRLRALHTLEQIHRACRKNG